MNFEPELLYCFYCISVLIYFIAVVFELGIFGVIDEFLAETLILPVGHSKISTQISLQL